jgi:putative ABC transport system permease protein
MSGIDRDVRYALRGLWKDRGFTFIAVATLALGIGATTTIYSFVNAVVLRPLPFSDSARLVLVQPEPRTRTPEPFRVRTVTPADFLEWQIRNRVFDKLAGFSGATFSLTGGGDPERLQAATVRRAARVNPLVALRYE